MVRSLRVQSQQLPTDSQVLKDEVLAGTASADHPAEEMSERRDHSKNLNLSGKVRIELFAKSFIFARVRGFGEAQVTQFRRQSHRHDLPPRQSRRPYLLPAHRPGL